jgi:cytochrome oxidase Cu insertion factor (SCO1/SenC/PrrC family)
MRYPTIRHVVFALALAGCAETWRAPPASPPALPSDHPSAAAAPRRSLFGYSWTWTDDHGERVALSRWRGTPLVVAAVYTSCVEICPLTVGKLHSLYRQFVQAGRRAEFVLVTLDPAIDTQARLREFRQARKLPDAWHLLTGNRHDTDQLMELLDVHVMDMDAHLVHDSRITLFDAGGFRTAELDVP